MRLKYESTSELLHISAKRITHGGLGTTNEPGKGNYTVVFGLPSIEHHYRAPCVLRLKDYLRILVYLVIYDSG